MTDRIEGAAILLEANTGTDQAPVWTALGGQKDCTLDRSLSTEDVSAKDSNGNEESLPGRKSWTVDLDKFMLAADTAYDALEAAFENRALVQVRIARAGKTGTGKAYVTRLSEKYPEQGGAEVSLSLKGSGPINWS